MRNKVSIFSALILIAVLLSICLFSKKVEAVREYKQRDYISERAERFHGVSPRVGIGFTLSRNDSQWPQEITFSMKKTRSILVRIHPISKPAGIIMLGSQPSSPRMVKAVWGHDDIRNPIEFWTSQYWISTNDCDYTGCPRIRFQVREGTVGVTVINKKETSKAYIK